MKKLTATMMQETFNRRYRRLTVGLDLGDRSSFFCVLDEAGDVVMGHRLSTTPKAIKGIFGNEASEPFLYIKAYSTNAKPIQWKYSDPPRRIRSNELTATGH